MNKIISKNIFTISLAGYKRNPFESLESLMTKVALHAARNKGERPKSGNLLMKTKLLSPFSISACGR